MSEICGLYLTLKYPHSSRVVVDSPRSSQGSDNDGRGGDEIVGEGVVQVALELEDILDRVEFFLVSVKYPPANVSKPNICIFPCRPCLSSH